MTGELSLRRLTQSDLAALCEVGKETFLDTFASKNRRDNILRYVEDAFCERQVLSELGDKGSSFYFAEKSDKILGYLKVNYGDAQNEAELASGLEIERIYVRRAHQGLGVGKAFMSQAHAMARSLSLGWLWLGVWEENPKAIQFYKKLGFVEFGEHEFVLGDERQRDIIMKLSLGPTTVSSVAKLSAL